MSKLAGFEIGLGEYCGRRETIRQAKPAWLRLACVHAWVQPDNVSQWRWPAALDADLEAANQDKIPVVLTLKGCPPWARKESPGDAFMAPPDRTSDFTNFVYRAVRRYSKPPFNVWRWEVWNEPNFPAIAPENAGGYYFGGFGFQGGARYGDFLKRCQWAIRWADPKAWTYYGGLMLHSNGSHLDFLDQSVKAGGVFDALIYHHYVNYDPSQDNLHRDAAIFLQLAYDELKKKTNKPIVLGETALLFDGASDDPDFRQEQAWYCRAVNEWAVKNRVIWSWYCLQNPWFGCGLLKDDGAPYPAFEAFESL